MEFFFYLDQKLEAHLFEDGGRMLKLYSSKSQL
jgi:hypothetical protein